LDRQLHAANAAGELMSVHQGFRRQPVPPQVAQKHQAITIPAPAAGLTDSDNLAFMKPGTAVYSVLAEEWPAVRAGLEARLATYGDRPVLFRSAEGLRAGA